MKIAILTQPLGTNYGGMIQAFALQQVLKDAGHLVVTIDRKKSKPTTFERLSSLGSRTLKRVTGRRKAPIFIENYYQYMYQHTQKFIDDYINFSDCFTTTKTLKKHFDNEQYDAVIVGSDQVWRADYSPNIHNYFLDFLQQDRTIIKISYAASFGLSSWRMSEQETLKCAKLAKQFNSVSVREEDAVMQCEEYLGVEAKWVCDPTLLIPKERYLSLISNYQSKVEGDLFYYLLDSSKLKENSLEKVEKLYNMKAFTCYPKKKHFDIDSADMDEFVFPPVEQWLASFQNAKLVVTDSFHGVVFSLIFQIPFLVFINEARGASRIYSLIKLADFGHRLIKNTADLDQALKREDLFEPEYINQEFIEQSRAFLFSTLKKNNEM